jgi:hypothetical protein
VGTAPTDRGSIVLQAGDGNLAVAVDLPRAQIPMVPDADVVEILVETDLGLTAWVDEAVDVADGVDLPPGTVRSITTVQRDEDGAVVALDAGSFVP